MALRRALAVQACRLLVGKVLQPIATRPHSASACAPMACTSRAAHTVGGFFVRVQGCCLAQAVD